MFFIWVIINVLELEEQLKTQHSLISDEAKSMLFMTGEYTSKNDLIDLLKDKKVLLEGTIIPSSGQKSTEIKGVYYNYPIEKQYPLMEGRMFTLEEIENKKKVALVGYNLKNQIKDNIINIQGEAYKVVGLLGDKKGSGLKDSIYINLNSKDFSLNLMFLTLDSPEEKASDVALYISNSLKEGKNTFVQISEPYGMQDPLKQAIGNNKLHVIIALLVSICLVSTVINISSYWIDKEKSIIGIKSLVGGTKRSISAKFWLEYEGTIGLSLISSYLITMLLNYEDGSGKVFLLKGLGLLAAINIIVSTLAILPPIIKLNRLNVNSIIKENI